MSKIAIIAVIVLTFTGCGKSIENSVIKEAPNPITVMQQATSETTPEDSTQNTQESAKASDTANQKITDHEIKPSQIQQNTSVQNTKLDTTVPVVNINVPASNSPQTQTNTPDTTELVKIGMSESEMVRILGGPKSINYDEHPLYSYFYGNSKIYVLNGNDGVKVVGWWNGDRKLRVTTGDVVHSSTFTVGSSREDVARSTGTPRVYDPTSYLHPDRRTYWEYEDGSRVDFDGNSKVISWRNNGRLKVSLGTKKSGTPPIKLGSTMEEVTSAFGTPTNLGTSIITNKVQGIAYDKTGIVFDEAGKVVAWSNKGTKNINIGDRNPSAPAANPGSSFQNVINAMGTPESLTASSFSYRPFMLEYILPNGRMVYYLDERTQIVTRWDKLNEYNHIIETSKR
jgi:hypothetical protein